MPKRTKRIGEFVAHDPTGREYVICAWQDIIEERTFDGVCVIPGMKSLTLRNGEKINRVSKGHYETLHGQTLTSNDPEAP